MPDIQKFIKTIENTSLEADRKMYYIEKFEKYGGLTEEFKKELITELKDQNKMINTFISSNL